MQNEYTKLLANILDQISRTDHIRPESVPDIDLYMDQVTSFMEDNLKKTRRYDTDKILTKTMINNYTKNHLLPHPQKKKYSREHMLMLVFIYYFKDFLPLSDIQALLTPIADRFFQTENPTDIKDIYSEVYRLGKEQVPESIRDILNDFHTASHSFADCQEYDRDFLQLFAFICLLSFDIYLKKDVIQKMIDAFLGQMDK